jgi:hypothetical protein
MISLGAHEEKLLAIATLVEQLFVQQFRNVPAKAADETLADWEKTAAGVLKDHPEAAGYVKDFYGEIHGALAHIRSKAV